MTDHSDNSKWERTVNLPLMGTDKENFIRISTNGYGVYLSIVRVDKNDKITSFLLFPEQLEAFTQEIPDLIKHAYKHDERIYKQNQDNEGK